MASASAAGAEDFLRLSKALKEAGRSQLRKELNKGLKNATKPLIAKTRAAAREQLPQSGGLAAMVAKAPQRVQVRTGQQTAGVRIVATGRVVGGNRGRLRHPVFGNREIWVTQSVHPGWFDATLRASAPLVRPELMKAMQRVIETVVREVR